MYKIGQVGIERPKFRKDINGKLYGYSGQDNEMIFLEELISNAIFAQMPNLKMEILQLIVRFENIVFFMTFNDVQNDYDGEDTLEYSLDEFSMESIQESLQDFILNPEKLIVVEKNGDELSFFSERDIQFSVNINDVMTERMVASHKRIFELFKRNALSIMLTVIIISSSFFIYNWGNIEIQKVEEQIKADKVQLLRSNLQIQGMENEMKDKTKQISEIESQPDILKSNIMDKLK